MTIWHFAKDGKPAGEMSLREAIPYAKQNPDVLAWREGMTDWKPAATIAELMHGDLPLPSSRHHSSQSDEIDYRIIGDDMQFVEIELDPDETAVAEAGAMMYKSPVVEMTSLLGDGSDQGLVGKLLGVGKRIMTGESAFITAYTHQGGHGKAHVGFAAPYPGKIIPVHLTDVGGTLICQKDSFLCAAKGVSIGIHFQRRILTGLFGGEGFVMQKMEGDGFVFVHAGGTISEHTLSAGQELHVDTGCIVAMTGDVDFDLTTAGGIKTQLFGGEGVFLAHLTGPGKVWLQSLPFSRLAGRMLMAAPQLAGKNVGES